MTSRSVAVVRSVVLAGGLLLVPACLVPVGALQISDDKYKAATAGAIGCPSSEIQLSGQSNTVTSTPVEWRAECRGRRFICSGAGNAARCTEELTAAASAKP